MLQFRTSNQTFANSGEDAKNEMTVNFLNERVAEDDASDPHDFRTYQSYEKTYLSS